jgi:hypothetical protein
MQCGKWFDYTITYTRALVAWVTADREVTLSQVSPLAKLNSDGPVRSELSAGRLVQLQWLRRLATDRVAPTLTTVSTATPINTVETAVTDGSVVA